MRPSPWCKEGTYAGKWKLGALLTRYTEKASWSYDIKAWGQQ
jgi:hypothetical protein